jgi:hypothetical protein
MNASTLKTPLACAALLALFAAQAGAATIRVQCEQRGTERAKVSVDGKNLARGSYSAVIVSGANMAAAPAKAAVGDEAQFDFDSNPADIAAGATAIAATFIVNGSLTGKIVDTSGNTVIADTVACRVRR